MVNNLKTVMIFTFLSFFMVQGAEDTTNKLQDFSFGTLPIEIQAKIAFSDDEKLVNVMSQLSKSIHNYVFTIWSENKWQNNGLLIHRDTDYKTYIHDDLSKFFGSKYGESPSVNVFLPKEKILAARLCFVTPISSTIIDNIKNNQPTIFNDHGYSVLYAKVILKSLSEVVFDVIELKKDEKFTNLAIVSSELANFFETVIIDKIHFFHLNISQNKQFILTLKPIENIAKTFNKIPCVVLSKSNNLSFVKSIYYNLNLLKKSKNQMGCEEEIACKTIETFYKTWIKKCHTFRKIRRYIENDINNLTISDYFFINEILQCQKTIDSNQNIENYIFHIKQSMQKNNYEKYDLEVAINTIMTPDQALIFWSQYKNYEQKTSNLFDIDDDVDVD